VIERRNKGWVEKEGLDAPASLEIHVMEGQEKLILFWATL
jgi:hypothetical protein